MPGPLRRIATFDLLRGYYLSTIIVDHMGKFPSLYDLLTQKGLGWTSAAEGFFFLSGLVIGLVRGNLVKQDKFTEAWKKIWQRALELYLWSVGLTLGFTAWAEALNYRTGVKGGYLEATGTLTMVKDAFLLHYSYGWTDYLPHYAIFLFWTPLALYLLRRSKWWVVPVLSLSLWFVRGTNFNLAWQLLFFGGMSVGYFYDTTYAWYQRLAPLRERIIRWSITAAALATFVLSDLQLRNYIPAPSERELDLLNKLTLGTMRLGVFLLWFVALYLFFDRYQKQIQRTLGWFLLPLGQNSLYTYIASSVLIFFLDLYLVQDSYGLIFNLTLDTSIFLLVWVSIKYGHARKPVRAHQSIPAKLPA